MAKMNKIFIVLLLFAILFVISTAEQRQGGVGGGVRRQQRPRPGAGLNGNGNAQQNKKKKPVRPQQQQQHQQQHQQQQQNQQDSPQSQQNANKVQLITRNFDDLGRIRGRIIKSEWSGKDIIQFLDIPYGKSPVGPLRFKPSVPADRWKGELPAHRYSHGCPSLQDFQRFEKLLASNVDIEDCLSLSISTKSLEAKAPVMVYIHGDFLYDGDTSEAAPGYLLEEDVVLVAVRYRLGPLGFLSTMSEDIPGNAAVYDVILALKWIQNHIASFGGDADRVTLFGQVGGSALVNVLTLSPAVPKGLFHRVIYHSASALSPSFITDTPISATRDIGRIAGCKNVNKIESLNKCMRKLNATALLDAFYINGNNKADIGLGFYGGVQLVIGGPSGILPEHPGKLLATDQFTGYPTLGGSVKHGGSFILRDIYVDSFNQTVLDDSLTGIQYIERVIEQTNGADPTGAWMKYAQSEIFSKADIENGTFKRLVPGLIDLCSTISFKNPILLVMQANAKKLPNSTFLYSFDYQGEMNRYTAIADEGIETPFDLGVSLTDDNLYLFPWPRFNTLNSNSDIKIAKRMVELWTSFATTGVPKAVAVPEWRPMSDETGPYMKIDKTITFGENYLDEYSVAIKETKLGYNLVNDEYFEDFNEEEEEDTRNEQHTDENEGRGTKLVFIARRRNNY